MKIMRKLFKTGYIIVLGLLLFVSCHDKRLHKGKKTSFSALIKGFKSPPDSVKPSVYWYWLSDNISKEGVKKDVESMAKAGIGRAFIGNIGLSKDETSYGDVKFLSDQWWDVTQQAMHTATKEGVDIGLFNSPGWSQSGGPWVKPKDAMRYLAHIDTVVKGSYDISGMHLNTPKNFQDISVLAYPAPKDFGKEMASLDPQIDTQPHIKGAANLIDEDTSTVASLPTKIDKNSTITINLQVGHPFLARSLRIYPSHNSIKADMALQVYKDGHFQTVKHFEFDRSNPALHVGFKPYGPVAISFLGTKAKKYRLKITNIQKNGGLAEIKLSSGAHLERYIEKQLAKMYQTPQPLWKEYQWHDQPKVQGQGFTIDPSNVKNISDHLSKDGILNWDVPKGTWIISRFGMKPTGVTNAPAAPEATGLEVDKMNTEALKHHFNAFVGKVLKHIPKADQKSWKYVVADSYETGSETWTDGFAKAFKKEYGYDPTPWLPVFEGYIVKNEDESNRFLWDVRRLVANRIAYKYVGGLRKLAHKHGLKIWLENYGHWGFPAEFLQYGGQSDEVAGEFWAEGSLGSIEIRAASSAAHIYGKNKVSAESFTAGGKAFARYPGMIKKRGDWAFTEGVNNTLLHVYIEQPYEDRFPGVNAGFGTEFNRKNTWFSQVDLFTDYLRRCMFMLQQGKPVADVAYFIGEDTPKMTGIRDPKLPDGYSFDYINAEVIENRLSVRDGTLVLPDGMSYRMLVLPPLKTMRPKLLKKIKSLVNKGATVLGPKPKRSPSLENYPKADKKVKKMANQLWGKVDGKTVKSSDYGKGMILSGMDMHAAFDTINLAPDFKRSSNDPIIFTHRKSSNRDIYFISNQSDSTVMFTPKFRVTGKQPELFDAVSGQTRGLPQFTQTNGYTSVPLKMGPSQSYFVVFKKSGDKQAQSKIKNFPNHKMMKQLDGPWSVTFNADSIHRGPDNHVEFRKLQDWTKRPEPSIKYYSGSATYQTTFEVPSIPKGKQMMLDLSKVDMMAKVSINGQKVGGVWTYPWQVNVSDAIQKGKNTLKIKVVNTWVNRLIGDQKLPPKQRPTWTNVNPYHANSPLQSSGLMGPVTLQKISYK